MLKTTMMRQLKKSVEVEKMPSVRVRPTLKNEVKQRVMKVKMPDDAKDEMINLEDLEDRVLMSVKKSKRANIGGENYQMELIENCRKEIA